MVSLEHYVDLRGLSGPDQILVLHSNWEMHFDG
jgi:hypothetical protein